MGWDGMGWVKQAGSRQEISDGFLFHLGCDSCPLIDSLTGWVVSCLGLDRSRGLLGWGVYPLVSFELYHVCLA
jgi:hypothetical protein